MSVEIELNVDGRTLLLDIEPNTLQALKNEFDEYCDEDEALKRRRQSRAPTFSMYSNDNVLKEVKRKHLFSEGETVVVQWTSLELEVPDETTKKPLLEEAEKSKNTKTVLTAQNHFQKVVDQDKGKDLLAVKKPEHSSNQIKHSIVPSQGENDCENEKPDSEDSEYGLVKEYVTDNVWKKLPKYIKQREKNRFELHEKKLKDGITKEPFEFDICAANGNDISSSSNSSSPPSPRTRNKSKRNRKVVTSDSGSSASNYSDHVDRNNETSSSSNSECSSEKVPRQNDKLSKPSTSSAQQSTFSTSSAGSNKSEIQKMKPQLPRYNIPQILKKIEKKGNDEVQATIQNLNKNGILVGKERRLLIRILVRHLFFKIAKDPKQATPDMREGLAKSIVLDYPKFGDSCDGKTTYPWKSLFDRQGRGWIANAARAIQKKYRTKKSVKRRKKDSSHNGETGNNKVSDTEVQALALLMPGRAEKGEILDGMKRTFSLRQAARSRQDSVREMLEKFPHLTNYDGEVLQEEFKRLRPNAQDMSLKFQREIPKIIALGTPSKLTLPFEDDVLKALGIMSSKLPRDIKKRTDPKSKSTTADFHDIVEFVQLGQDIDAFVSEKVRNAKGPIQPYLVMVKSPVRNSIVKCFLILDQKPVQLSTTSIVKSFEFLLKSYFIFNVNYPLGWRGVFHCLATCFANVFEDQGARKRPDSSTPSERDFMNSIKDLSE